MSDDLIFTLVIICLAGAVFITCALLGGIFYFREQIHRLRSEDQGPTQEDLERLKKQLYEWSKEKGPK